MEKTSKNAMAKKMLSVFLAIALCFAFIPTRALAAEGADAKDAVNAADTVQTTEKVIEPNTSAENAQGTTEKETVDPQKNAEESANSATADVPLVVSSDGDTFDVALTIVDDTTNPATVVYNGKVSGMTAENTVTDLLSKAGFTKVDSQEQCTTDRQYWLKYGFPYFLGKDVVEPYGPWVSPGTDYASISWVDIFNGSSKGYDSVNPESNLQENGHYQYIYAQTGKNATDTANFKYTSDGESKWTYDEPGGAIPNPLVSDPGPSPTPDPDPTPAYDASKAGSLVNNLIDEYSKGGSFASMSKEVVYAAIAMNSLGKGGYIDTDSIISDFVDNEPVSAGAYGKYIMMLTAGGVDCSKASVGGTERNLVNEMEALLQKGMPGIWSEVFILPVYTFDKYEDSNGYVDNLINSILSSQDSSTGLFGGEWADAQTTAQAILALQPYQDSRDDVEAALDKAVSSLRALQNTDGGFSYKPSEKGTSNFDATANIIAAFIAMGIDCTKPVAEDTSTISAMSLLNAESITSSPLGFLMDKANSNQTDFDYTKVKPDGNHDMSRAVGFLALAAQQNFEANGDKAYNVYTLKAAEKPEEKSDTDADASSKSTSVSSGMSNTGDKASEPITPLVMLLIASGAIAAIVAIAATRKYAGR